MSDVASSRWLLYTGLAATAITCYLCTRRIRQAPDADADDDRDPADFGAFLKKRTTSRQPPPKHMRDPADFGAFLKSTYKAGEDAPQEATAPAAAPVQTGPRPEQAVVTVLYGTEYGFSKEIAEVLCDKLTAQQGESIWYDASCGLCVKGGGCLCDLRG